MQIPWHNTLSSYIACVQVNLWSIWEGNILSCCYVGYTSSPARGGSKCKLHGTVQVICAWHSDRKPCIWPEWQCSWSPIMSNGPVEYSRSCILLSVWLIIKYILYHQPYFIISHTGKRMHDLSFVMSPSVWKYICNCMHVAISGVSWKTLQVINWVWEGLTSQNQVNQINPIANQNGVKIVNA